MFTIKMKDKVLLLNPPRPPPPIKKSKLADSISKQQTNNQVIEINDQTDDAVVEASADNLSSHSSIPSDNEGDSKQPKRGNGRSTYVKSLMKNLQQSKLASTTDNIIEVPGDTKL
jgi:hypothetical protein